LPGAGQHKVFPFAAMQFAARICTGGLWPA
jgi:hypothetical protein